MASRVPYNREYWVYPTDSTPEQRRIISEEAARQQVTVGPSYDDAGIGDGLGQKVAVLWDIPNGEWLKFLTWYKENYPGTIVRFRYISEIWEPDEPGDDPPDPPPDNKNQVLLGLHASADPPISGPELTEFRILKPGVIKVLSSNDRDGVAYLRAQNRGAKFIVRAFLNFGYRNVTPQQFFDWTISDVRRTLEAIGPGKEILIELHNEPNLFDEGLSYSWATAPDFNYWYRNVVRLYRNTLHGVKFMFPGLSPGHDITGIRQSHKTFIRSCAESVKNSDALGVHAYWSPTSAMSKAVEVVKFYADLFPGKEIWVTEASNNGTDLPSNKAKQYLKFVQELQKLGGNIRGVTYFVASSINPKFANEVWVGNNIAKLIDNERTT
jgi:hypothetical protein